MGRAASAPSQAAPPPERQPTGTAAGHAATLNPSTTKKDFAMAATLLSPLPAPSALACSIALALAPLPALAQNTAPAQATSSLYLQVARASEHTQTYTVGLTRPWATWQSTLWGAPLRGHWDLHLSQWASDHPGGRQHTTVLGITPTLRLWPGGLGAAWFVEGGIGAVLANRRYSTPSKTFSTRFNFASHLGVGVRLGAQQQHEWLLRVQHVSNAGLKKPNPGENFLQLRYALHF